jgi:hypothetical protein
MPSASDHAIRVAAKLAIDDGDLGRARALLDLLEKQATQSTRGPTLATGRRPR